MAEKKTVHDVLNPAGWPKPKGYANGMRARGIFVFTGGNVGWDANEKFPKGFVAQTKQALDSYARAIAHDPHLTEAYRRRGDLHWQNSDIDAALAEYDHALKRAPGDALSLLGRGRARLAKGQHDAGLSDLDDAANVLLRSFVVGGGGGLEQTDVEDHVDVVSAEFDDAGGLVALGGREGGAEGEADDDADGDAGALEDVGGEGDPSGVDHGAGETVGGGLFADLDDLVAGGVWLEERVIEDGGQIGRRRESMRGEGCCVVGLVRCGCRGAHGSPSWGFLAGSVSITRGRGLAGFVRPPSPFISLQNIANKGLVC